jgi:hypothetical protein
MKNTTRIARMFDPAPILLGSVPGEFILFALVLAGIALLQRHTLEVAITGLAAVTLYKLEFTGFAQGPGLAGWHVALAYVVGLRVRGILATPACGCEQRNVILIAHPALGFFGASRERGRHPSPCAKS